MVQKLRVIYLDFFHLTDSSTVCPEHFNELFNQRRRWEAAKILGYFMDHEKFDHDNALISSVYKIYQQILIIGTLLGPGSVLAMIAGSLSLYFKIAFSTALIINLIPIITFMVMCSFLTPRKQIKVAKILNIGFILEMVVIIIRVMIELTNGNWLAPANFMILFTFCCYVITGIMHPQDLQYLPMGIIYVLSIPCMHIILIIYAIFSLDKISFGYRNEKKTPKEIEAERAEAEIKAKEKELMSKQSLFERFLGKWNSTRMVYNYFSNFFGKNKSSKKTLQNMNEKLEKIENILKEIHPINKIPAREIPVNANITNKIQNPISNFLDYS